MSDLNQETTTEQSTSSEVQSEAVPNVTLGSVIEESNTSSTNWKDTLPEDIRNDATMENIKDVEALSRSYVSAQRMLGGRIPIPSKEASKEIQEEFYKKLETIPDVVRLPTSDDPQAELYMSKVYDKLGRPKAPENYTIDAPEGMPLDEQFVNSIKEVAHKVGLNQKQLDALAKVKIQQDIQVMEAYQGQKANVKTFLEKEWGNARDTNMSSAKAVISKYGEKYPDAVNEIYNGTVGNNPVVIMMAAELGKLWQENGTVAVRDGVRSSSRTPEQALQLISEIRSNKQHPYHSDRSPGHEEAVARMKSLYDDAYPNPNQSE